MEDDENRCAGIGRWLVRSDQAVRGAGGAAHDTYEGGGVLTGLFWLTAIFGVGVTVVDLLGLIGGGTDDAGGDQDGGGAASGGAPVLSFLRWVRTLVYFCLGFGPFGLAAGAFGSGPIASLIWSLAGGVSMSVLARLFFRFQRTRLDSSLHDEELLMEPATVIVPIAVGSMGKVRVHFGQSVAERYARAEDGAEEFASGDRVVIARITEQCVYVRKEDP